MAKVRVEYTLEHEDVMEIICGYFRDKHGLTDVTPDELQLNVQEYRLNEGYSGPGPDQPARINFIKLEV